MSFVKAWPIAGHAEDQALKEAKRKDHNQQ
jgi:hypothetical protein